MIAHTNSLAEGWHFSAGPYRAAKAALRMDTYRMEYADSGIRFISIYPGFVATAATQGDGIPAPTEVSEDAAVTELLAALSAERNAHTFSRITGSAVAVGRMMPERLRHAILRRVVTAP